MGKQVFSCPPNKQVRWKLLAKTKCWLLTVEDKNLMKKVKDISVTMQKFWGLYVQLKCVAKQWQSWWNVFIVFERNCLYSCKVI